MKSSLSINIYSFGYHKSGIPQDETGNGGGYVFDCRGLENPGRQSQFLQKTGQDQEVIHFLEKETNVDDFLNNIFSLVFLHAQNYEKRQFKNLMVSFGCTGGQHRSVYCAEKMTQRLKQEGYSVFLTHIDKPDLIHESHHSGSRFWHTTFTLDGIMSKSTGKDRR